LGKGRLNMERALTDTISPSIRLTQFDVSNSFGDYAFYGDTLAFEIGFENFLDSAKNATVSISIESEYATLTAGDIAFGTLGTLETYEPSSPLQITLNDDTPANERILIRLDYSADNYEDWQFIQFNTTPDYLNLASDNLSLTVAGNGNLGYQLSALENGSGMNFDAEKLVDHVGLILSADGAIFDNVVNDFDNNTRSNDFQTTKNIRLFNHDFADVYMTSSFNDLGSDAPLGLLIEQKAMAWISSSENYLVVEYRISNNSLVDIAELNAAIFADWILGDTLSNSVGWDATLNLGYGFDNGISEIYSGIALLSAYDSIFYAIDQNSLNGNTSDVGITISKAEKSTFVNSGATKISSGLNGGNDVAQVSGGGMGSLASGESKKVAFAFVAGASLEAIQNEAIQAKIKYENFLNNPQLIAVDTACVGQPHSINPNFGTNFEYYSDPLGANLLYSGNDFVTGTLNNDTTFYLQNIDSLIKTDIKSMNLHIYQIVPDFNISLDTLLLGDIANNVVSFEDLTDFSVSRLWDFDNETGSTAQNPISQFNSIGDYTITLSVTDKFGCTSEVAKVLRVREREIAPEFGSFIVCKGDPVSIRSKSDNFLKVYSSSNSSIVEFQGVEFISQPVTSDTTFTYQVQIRVLKA